jgi:hypothetical protein
MALETASGKIEEALNELLVTRRRLQKRKKNKKQLQMLAGITFWQTL